MISSTVKGSKNWACCKHFSGKRRPRIASRSRLANVAISWIEAGVKVSLRAGLVPGVCASQIRMAAVDGPTAAASKGAFNWSQA